MKSNTHRLSNKMNISNNLIRKFKCVSPNANKFIASLKKSSKTFYLFIIVAFRNISHMLASLTLNNLPLLIKFNTSQSTKYINL